MNRRAKFDAVSFILGGEIRIRRNTQTHTQTNSKRYIHTLPIGMCGYNKVAQCVSLFSQCPFADRKDS